MLFNRVTFTRGVHSIVHFGDSLARIEDKIIWIIQSRMDSEGLVRVGEEFKYGDPVIIDYGPFKSLIGMFERDIGDAERVRILLTTISYQAHLTVDKHSVTKALAVVGGTARINQLNTENYSQRVHAFSKGSSWA
jgi:transcription antitermination factor NusG